MNRQYSSDSEAQPMLRKVHDQANIFDSPDGWDHIMPRRNACAESKASKLTNEGMYLYRKKLGANECMRELSGLHMWHELYITHR